MIDAGLKIKELRKENKLSQMKLSDITGYHWRTIQQWENGKAVPLVSAWIDAVEAMGYEIKIERSINE